MKAKVSILLFILFLGVNCYSQVKPFRFGVTVAPNLAWLSPDTKDYKNDGNHLGFSWGFIADITLTENYFVKTGINMDYLNVKLVYPDSMIVATSGTTDTIFGNTHRKYKLQYIEVPLTLKLRTNQFGKVAYYGEIGLGTAFNLKAKAKDQFEPTGDESESDIKDDIAFMKESLIFGAGLEYFIDNSTSLIFQITFHNGLSNILKGENNVSHETQRAHLHYFQLNVGVMF